MNWNQIEGNWKQSIGKIQEKWGKLTDNDLIVIDGKKEQLIGRIQERYGILKEVAEKQVDEFTHAVRHEGSTKAKSKSARAFPLSGRSRH